MAIKYGKFELPVKIKIDESSKGHARVVAEPFEKGFGHTVGNALRRILLTALEAPALISVSMEGVSHEYAAVEGVIEDMTHIILNLKKGLLRKLPHSDEANSRSMKTVSKVLDVTQEMLDKNGGQYVVTLGDLLGDSEFEVVSPELRIFTATKPMKRQMAFRVMISRGYTPSEAFAIPAKFSLHNVCALNVRRKLRYLRLC